LELEVELGLSLVGMNEKEVGSCGDGHEAFRLRGLGAGLVGEMRSMVMMEGLWVVEALEEGKCEQVELSGKTWEQGKINKRGRRETY
jgi:hypothetical protein